MYIMGTVAILLIGVAAMTLLRLRLRFDLSPDTRRIFVGLGRTGLELDFLARRQRFRLFGRKISESSMNDEKAPDPLQQKSIAKAVAERPSDIDARTKPTESPPKTKPARRLRGRVRPWRDVVRILPGCAQALWGYALDLLRSVVVEELEAEIEAGFDSPDLTGITYGYYQAALAAVPGVVGHVRFTPDWSGPSFAGRVRGSVALPLYRLILRSVVLLWRLPLRDLIKLAIGKKRGVQDGQ